MKPFRSTIVLLLFLAPFTIGFAQYDSLSVGTSSGPDIYPGLSTWFLQTNVTAGNQPALGDRELDINGDMVPDLRFEMQVYEEEVDSMSIAIRTLNGAEVRILSPSNFADSLSPGQLLLASDNWSTGYLTTDSMVPVARLIRGNLAPINDVTSGTKYLGVRFPVGGTWNYAWIKYFAFGYSFHWGGMNIESYAWKGDAAPVGLFSPFTPPPIALFPNPGTGHYYIEFKVPCPKAIVTVRNAIGQTISQFKCNNSEFQPFSIEEAPGMYMVEVEIPGKIPFLTKLIKR